MLRLFDPVLNDPNTCFSLASQDKQDGWFIEFVKFTHGGTRVAFIIYDQNGEEYSHNSLVSPLSQDTLNDIAQAAREGHDALISKLKTFNTPNDRFCDFVKYGVIDVEKANNRQNAHPKLTL